MTKKTSETNLTKLEGMGLHGIMNSEFHDGGDPVGNAVWTWSCHSMAPRVWGGVVASLQRKGLITCGMNSKQSKDATVALTQAGLDAVLAWAREGGTT